MDISITNVHLDLGAGRRGTDMGPSAMYVAGLVPRLKRLDHRIADIAAVDVMTYEMDSTGAANARFLASILETVTLVADRVERACDEGLFPLVLGGYYSQAIGTISGLVRHYRRKKQRIGVLWVDAHTDMNTPDTTISGNIHGMPLAAMLGYGVSSLTTLVDGGPALDPRDVAIIGARDVDSKEILLVKETGVRVYTMHELDERGTAVCIREALARVTAETAGVHLSFDLDGVDPDDAPGVGTPVPGGLSLREAHLLCELVHESGLLLGMEMVELNPTLDIRNKTAELAVWMILSALGKQTIPT